MTLEAVPLGARAVVTELDCTPSRGLRWAQLGLRPGTQVVVRSRTSGGGRVLGVGLARIAVDRSVLASVRVELTS